MACRRKKIKAGRQLLFLVGDNFYMSEESLTVKYSESGLIGLSFMTLRFLMTSSRTRDVACDITDVQKIGIEVLCMPNFEF